LSGHFVLMVSILPLYIGVFDWSVELFRQDRIFVCFSFYHLSWIIEEILFALLRTFV